MKRFKIALEEKQEYKPKRVKRNFSYCREGFFDLFKSKPKESEKKKEPEKEYTFEDFEKELETSQSAAIHLDCDTFDNQIKFLKAYKSVLIPILIKEMDKLTHVLNFIKSKGTSIIDHTDELVDMSWPKDHSYKPKLMLAQYPEFSIHYLASDSIEKQKAKKYTRDDIYNVEEEYSNITDKDEQVRLVRLLTYSDHVVLPIYLKIEKFREKNQEKTILNTNDAKFKIYIELCFEIIRKLKSLKSKHDELWDLVYKAENNDFPDYGDGDEYGIRRLTIHYWGFFREIPSFEHYFLKNINLSDKSTTVSTESLNDSQEVSYGSILSYANEGMVEKIATFTERLLTSQNKAKQIITSLKNKEVKEQFTKIDGGRYSGLKLIDLDKVDGKAIIKYLDLIKREREVSVNLVLKTVKEVKQILGIYSKTITKEAFDKLKRISESVEKAFEEVKEHSNESIKRDDISIQSASKQEFDKIIDLMILLLSEQFQEKVDKAFEELMDLYEEITKLKNYENEGEIAENIIQTSFMIIDDTASYLSTFSKMETQFFFSVQKYLQDSVS